jgi:hypothetical protein
LVFKPVENRIGFRVRDRKGGCTGCALFRHQEGSSILCTSSSHVPSAL